MKKLILSKSDIIVYYRVTANIHFNESNILDLIELRSETKRKNKWETDNAFFINKNESMKLFNSISKYLK